MEELKTAPAGLNGDREAYEQAASIVLRLGELTNTLEALGRPWRRRLAMFAGNLLIRHVMLPLSPYLNQVSEANGPHEF